MGTVVLAHVDESSGFHHTAKGGFDDGLRLSDKGHHRPVGGLAGLHIQQTYAFYGHDFICYLLDDILVAAFTEVRHTLNDLFFSIHGYKGLGFQEIIQVTKIPLLDEYSKFFRIFVLKSGRVSLGDGGAFFRC